MSKEKEKENDNNLKEEKEEKIPKDKNEEKEDDEKEYSKKIGDYILFEQIGQGTFSKVTRAFHIITEQIVAVKILDKQKIEDEIDIERIIREIEILRSISHPNISQMFETYSTVHNFYLMMEYVDGGDLFDYISDNCYLPEQKACFFFRQLVSVMEYLAELGISHRDIKPENILLDKDHSNIKVIDFGLSNYCMEHELLHSSCGSPCYASPEMLSGNPYSGITTDLWSAGIVLYSMLVGALPFDDQELHKLYEQIKLGKFYIPSTLSLEAIDLLKKILQVDPKKRISLQELKEHKWFNIENNPMYKGVNIFYEHLPCDTKVVQYVIKKYFSEDQDISLYSFIKMIHMHACNKYTATYYLVKKYILKVEDKLVSRKQKNSKNIVKQENRNTNEKDLKEEKDDKEEKENQGIENEKKEEKELYLNLKDIKKEFINENNLNLNEKDKNNKANNDQKRNVTKEKEFNIEKINNIVIDNEKNELKELNIVNNKKVINTRNIQNDIYGFYNINNTNIANNTNTNFNYNTNQMDKYFCLTLEEDSKLKTNGGNMNLFLSKDKYDIKPEYNKSNKIAKKYNHKKIIKQNTTQKNETENFQFNIALTDQSNIKKNKKNDKAKNVNKLKDKTSSPPHQNFKKAENQDKKMKKNEQINEENNSHLKIGLSLLNIKNINDKYKITNESNTDRNISERYKNSHYINKIYSPKENYTINTIYKNSIDKKNKKFKAYIDKIMSPKKGDLNFYVINNIINKDKQEKKKKAKNELFNLEIKSNINKKNFLNNNNENIIVNINNNNYINGNINRNQLQNISIDNRFFRTQEMISNDNLSKENNVSSQIKVNLKSSKSELKSSPKKNSDLRKNQNKIEQNNPQKKFEIEIFSNKIKNINKFKQRKTPSPFSLVHIQDNYNNEGSNIIKFNNNYINNFFGQNNTEKGRNIINLSSSQNKSYIHSTKNNQKNINNNDKKKLYKERIKKMVISHKKGKSLYSNCLESNNIFNYFKNNNNKKKKKNNHQRNISSVLKNQLSDFRSENKGINIISSTVVNNEYSSSKNKAQNKNTNTNLNSNTIKLNIKKESSINKNINTNKYSNILSYSKEKVISPKMIYQTKNNLQKKKLFLENNHNNNINSFVSDKYKKNKIMITTGNNNSKNFIKHNNYLIPLNQSNSTNNHFLTDNNNNYKHNKNNSNDNNVINNNNANKIMDNNYLSNLSLVLKNGINKNKKMYNNDLIVQKIKDKNNSKKQKKNIINNQNNIYNIYNKINNNNYY